MLMDLSTFCHSTLFLVSLVLVLHQSAAVKKILSRHFTILCSTQQTSTTGMLPGLLLCFTEIGRRNFERIFLTYMAAVWYTDSEMYLLSCESLLATGHHCMTREHCGSGSLASVAYRDQTDLDGRVTSTLLAKRKAPKSSKLWFC